MKKILLILAICLCLLTSLAAQNIWKPLNCNSCFLGADSEGNLFAMAGYSGLIRSQDEGETWTQVNDYYMQMFMAFSPNGRLFIFPSDHDFIFYSDDHGDTWQQTASHSMLNYYMSGAYAVNNDTLLLWGENHLHYTLDAGATWHDADMSFIGDEYHKIGDVIANETGDVYISKWYYSGVDSGIFHSTLSDMQNWELAAFDGAAIHQMEFDPDGNIVAGALWGSLGGFQQEPGFYLIDGQTIAVSDNGVVYHLRYNYTDCTAVLNYSTDHGEHFFDVGEELPTDNPAPGGGSGARIYKGHDNHLYFHGNGQYYKSVLNADEIVSGIGTLAKINAPYFENNVNDYRFAIINWIDTCYVMVNGVWPNPDAENLIVKYDTIPLGSQMDVTGSYHYMNDDHGNTFKVIDIQQYNNAIYSYSTGYLLSWSIDEIPHITDYYLNPKYYVAINGELQTEFPVTFNGLTLDIGDGIYTFVGIAETWPDYDLPILNLYDVIPYSSDLNINGIIMPGNVCMILPCNEDKYLSCSDGFQEFYLTNEGKLIEKSWFGPLWNDNTNSTIAGISGSVYDLYGNEVHTIEIREVESVGERTLNGQLEPTCYPPMGPYPPIGLDIAIVSDEFEYFIDNPHEDGFQPYCIIENDTLPFYQDITATISNSYMFIDGSNIKHFTVHLDNIEVVPEMFPIGTEWYYEITNDNGSVTYQYLECAADTTINDHPIHILVRINTLYDKSDIITHEYIYEEYNKVYWWNKTLGEFTTLYDFSAEVGDEWEIKVGTQTIPVHVDAAQTVTYKSQEYKMLSISDPDDIFTGDIICGIGHLTSFFPEKLMTKGYRVENIRCFWQDGELIYQNGDQDCDEIYEQHHLGVDEIDSENNFAVYPNPSHDVLYVLSDNINSEYRVTNLMGQTIMIGEITSENQMIAVSSLPKGIYFITVNNASKIFVIK
jgi:hypothetical protein